MRSSVARVLRYMAREKRMLTFFLLSSLASVALTMVMPWLVRDMIDYITYIAGAGRFNLWLLVWYAAAIVGLFVASGLFDFLTRYLSETVAQRTVYRLRVDLYKHLQDLSYSFYDRINTGQILIRVTGDMDTINRFIGFSFMRFVSSIMMVTVALAILIYVNLELTGIALTILPILAVVTIFFNRKANPLLQRQWTAYSLFNNIIKEYVAGVRVIKALGIEPLFRREYTNRVGEVYGIRLAFAKIASLLWPSVGFISALITVLVYLYGGFKVVSGALSIGDVIAFTLYLSMLNWPIISLGFFLLNYERASVSAQKIFEVLDAEPEVKENPDAIEIKKVRGYVRFENVTFGYTSGKPVLKNINLEVKPGEKVAIVGATGSGKSTLVKLLPRFYDPWEGRILLDGMDLRKIKLSSLRRHIGIVHQDVFIFAGTIRDNIAYGKPRAKMEEIVEAARAAGIHDFIVSLPQGYDTPVAERGVTLSGGQRQRIAIARTLLLNPEILILDDPTSNLDAETEKEVIEALKKLIEGKTVFIVTQRLSTLKLADRIIVLDDGRIVEEGTHEELMRIGGVYTRLYKAQFAHQEELLVREV